MAYKYWLTAEAEKQQHYCGRIQGDMQRTFIKMCNKSRTVALEASVDVKMYSTL